MSASQQPQQQVFYTVPYAQLLDDLTSRLSAQTPSTAPATLPEFVNDRTARGLLSGDPEKPISKSSFNALRKAGKISTYSPTQGRTLYSVSELNRYIQNSVGTVLPSKTPKSAAQV